ncbi:helix-turn-helix domain-containing protein [Streptomyces glaucus]
MQTAAAEFARAGYAGTSLMRICAAANMTMGALTFHFPSKRELADAVSALGEEATRSAVAGVPGGGPPFLQAVIDVSHAVTTLLGDDATVRAASRLCRDGDAQRRNWYRAWLPAVHELATQAHLNGELRPGVAPWEVTMLVACLVTGAQPPIPWADGFTGEHPPHPSRLWTFLAHGIAAAGTRRLLRPAGAGRGGTAGGVPAVPPREASGAQGSGRRP